MVNKQYLKENGLLEAHKKFYRMCQESYIPSIEEELEEEDNNEQQPPQNGGNGEPMGNNLPLPNSNDGQDTNQTEVGIGGLPQEGELQNTPQNNDVLDLDGDSDSDESPFGDSDEDEDKEDDGETIDIDDLTDAQEKLNHKTNKIGLDLGKVDDRIERLIASVGKIEQMIDSNNMEIIKLKQEFEKRNPTQVEKLELRRKYDSAGFTETPEEAMAKSLKERGNYDVTFGDEKPNYKQYTITKDDVNNINSNSIAQSFYKIDDDDIQDINKIFDLK